MRKSPTRTPQPEKRSRRQRWTAEKAGAVLASLAASGLSVQQFAAREGLDAERLYRWRRQLAARPGPGFLEILPKEAPYGSQRIQLVLASGHILFFPESIDAAALRRVLDALERALAC